jgi:hypothetical protein
MDTTFAITTTLICKDIEINKAPFILSIDNNVLFSPDIMYILMGHSMRMFRLLHSHGLNKQGRVDQIGLWKRTFGKQLKTWTGGSENRRFYIWTFKKDNSILYVMVHNEKGMLFEYTSRSDLNIIKYMVMKILFSIENIASWELWSWEEEKIKNEKMVEFLK